MNTFLTAIGIIGCIILAVCFIIAAIVIFSWLDKRCSCNHEWIEKYKRNLWDKDISTERPVETRVTLICKNCGRIKRIKL